MSAIVHYRADDGAPACDKDMGRLQVPLTEVRAEVDCVWCLRQLEHKHRGEAPRGQRDAFGQVTR